MLDGPYGVGGRGSRLATPYGSPSASFEAPGFIDAEKSLLLGAVPKAHSSGRETLRLCSTFRPASAQLGFFGLAEVFVFLDACFADLAFFMFFWFLAFVIVVVWVLAGVAANAGVATRPTAASEAIRLRFTVILLKGCALGGSSGLSSRRVRLERR
jgi:hypothetical protein